jgi:hypothetical protein
MPPRSRRRSDDTVVPSSPSGEAEQTEQAAEAGETTATAARPAMDRTEQRALRRRLREKFH